MAINLFNTSGILDRGQEAFKSAYDQGEAMRGDRTRMQAGRAYAGGDRQGAARMLAQGGNIDGARVLEGDMRDEEQRGYERQRQGVADKRQATMDQDAERSKRAAGLIKALGTLRTVPYGADPTDPAKERREALGHPLWSQAFNITPDMVAGLKPEDFSDAAIARLAGDVQKYVSTEKVGDDLVGILPNGTAERVYSGTRKPDWKERTNADGSSEWFDINEGQGGGQPGPQGSAPAPRPQRPMGDPDAVVAPFLAAGARVTSGVRTPERNTAVGGVKNSYHLQSNGGSARDLVPPQGVSMAQFHQRVQQGLPPGWQAINEGDHVHIEPGSYQVAQAGGNTPRPGGIRGDAPKPKDRWVDLPGGGQVNPATGEKKNVPNNNSDRKFIADTRKEFNGRAEVKEYRDVSSSYRQIYTLANKPATAAGDISMVFSFMKMLDPGSVVREGEFATAQNAAGVPDQVRNLWNRALSGTRLNDKQRKDFLNQASSIYKSRQGRFNEIANEYRGYAATAGENPDLIVTIPKTPAPTSAVGKAQTFNTSAGAVTVRAK